MMNTVPEQHLKLRDEKVRARFGRMCRSKGLWCTVQGSGMKRYETSLNGQTRPLARLVRNGTLAFLAYMWLVRDASILAPVIRMHMACHMLRSKDPVALV